MTRQEDFADMRRDYSRRGLSRADLAEDPFRQFGQWFETAKNSGLLEPNAMNLATVGADEATKLGQNRIFAAISTADRAKDA